MSNFFLKWLYITQKYKKINSKLKEKDKWIYYDEYGWGNLVPKNEKEFNKEEFINEFTYAYEDIWVAVPPSLSLILINIKYEPLRGTIN